MRKAIRLGSGCTAVLFILFLLGVIVYLYSPHKLTGTIEGYILDLTGYNRDNVLYLSLEEAVETGMPIYLPSPIFIETKNLNEPMIALKIYDSTCSYLDLDFYTNAPEHRRLYRVRISNGCAFPTMNVYHDPPVKVDWVKNQEVLVGTMEEVVYLRFLEPKTTYTYVIFSSESLPDTISFVESLS